MAKKVYNNKNPHPGWIIGGMVLVLVLVVGFFTNWTFSLNGSGAKTTVSLSGGACQIASGYPKLKFAGTYTVPSNGTVIQAATNVIGFVVGNATSFTGTLITPAGTGYVYSNQTVNCGQTVFAVFGDNLNYYQTGTSQVQITAASTAITTGQLLKIAALQTPLVANTLGLFASTTSYYGVTGSPTLNGKLYLAAGAGQYGVGEISVTYAYNTTEINKVTMTGPGVSPLPSTVGSPVPPTANVPSQFTTSSYQVPSLSWSNYTTLAYQIQTAALNSNTVINNPINVFINDQVNYIQNGQLDPLYINPNSKLDMGEAYTSVNAMINIYS